LKKLNDSTIKMKPLMLHGHERSITQIKYNLEGDLLFSTAKDNQPNVWFSINGERLGTYRGHGGAVWCLDVNYDTSKVLTGSADNTCRIWDAETGVQMHQLDTSSAVRTCGFSYGGQLLFLSTDKAMMKNCEVQVFDLRDEIKLDKQTPIVKFPLSTPKITAAMWGDMDMTIIAGHEDGEICHYDMKTNKKTYSNKDHSKAISDLQLSQDGTMLISSSKDFTAKLFDAKMLEPLKTFKTERPVNSAAISPIREHVVLGGGQDAMDVTTTSTRIGKFDARFFHMVFEEEFGRVKGHFGPINSVAFHPDGKSFSTGGEDGYVRIQAFDPSYFDFELDY